MIICENPKNKRLPQGMSLHGKYIYLAGGEVTVGKFSRLTDSNFIDFYLPRIRSINISKGRKYRHPGYETPDQAYTVGILMHKDIKIRAASGLRLEL